MKVIIAGSRSFGGDLDQRQMDVTLAELDWPITEVVSGGARGADLAGESWALAKGIPYKRFPADWNTHGKAAGIIRNREMANYADAAVVFWDGASRGAANMIEEMKGRAKLVKTVFIHVRPLAS